jgi:hypothetical protein
MRSQVQAMASQRRANPALELVGKAFVAAQVRLILVFSSSRINCIATSTIKLRSPRASDREEAMQLPANSNLQLEGWFSKLTGDV